MIVLMIVKFLKNFFHEKCYFRVYFHLYCPGCGGTRALRALLKFNIMQSLYYNPMVVILISVESFLLINHLCKKSGKFYSINLNDKKIRILVLFSWTIYFLIRNILLVIFGIEMLGDFSK